MTGPNSPTETAAATTGEGFDELAVANAPTRASSPTNSAPNAATRKAPENLTDRQRIALARVQHTNARLYRAYLLKEQLRALDHLDDPACARAP